ncbi:MAG: bifunctional 4-hydroxy-2-oxoglutarate aldolase/2-dehydro-3-deoxy-phosphogluconate aldolase [Hydrogenophaga sp.]|uniref:bifunctional 4-hydroxy-2-oxoglutarate aldolase/2-dehydro-3-deoxy-phosphogluconate aldolase n=1 Tax=Hydrogenophaga sp. TaxID=1904254 RepID=UPI00168FBC53|nr:bifunctional 4-hydroxy-2-oxoglutarate aldolase/2-dehydro-3-deoxy-phosphogluconate aldolase [Hydrogenophaga sp.]NIM43227.1 bifunctional 4-hydroxy-2-oxoglutarate aldolase/2-dehydro-3-deoxy-phosphogluconate aldolase [Hydrogenophaga sp.]NIN28295.1 bifunctional 4-hydroxy-2-oxoglutarate aldolase/2-dehydro-3-deoxy-phosphogluconate aldolase [Hydrogenophaga sp.]NIN29114.1 bifunctional 4-hydroxy-2-oxoglutarate aldolase/2-dehydro-3-deoxy-phosphogluconate aldolase [Hydrogenophaga sp.]NIN57430.1 bifuncti
MPDQHLTHPSFTSRVVPVIVLSDAKQAVPLAHALLEGGIDVMEITLRSDVALDAIEAVAKAVPQMHLGAGTVTRASDVPRVIDAGARFALSPGCTDALVDAMRATGLPFIPGVMTPGEVMRARDQGFTLMKLFPAQQAGGIGMLKALGAPIPDVRFCPTGGVSPENLRDFLALPNVAMAGGSWLTPADALRDGDWARVTKLAREATTLAQ